METTKLEVMEQLKKSVRPEFLNRIPACRQAGKSLEKMLAKNNIKIEVTDEAVKQIADEGFPACRQAGIRSSARGRSSA